MTPNVYVVNKSGHDISDAYRFGDVVYLSEGGQSRFATNNIHREFKPLLECSDKDDYILLTGLTVMNVIACSIFALIHKRLKLLIHDPKDNTYVERILDLHDIQNKNMQDVLQQLKT